MNGVSNFSKVVWASPAFLLLFLVIPITVVLNMVLHLDIPLVDFRLMLWNNICFALLVAGRLLFYLSRNGKAIRYGEDGRPSGEGTALTLSAAQARGVLSGDGYTFDARGNYGEKRDRGYLGTVALYAGFFVLLSTGCWDNLHQLAGSLLDGVGPATPLSRADSYRTLTRGVMAHKMDSLPALRVLSQVLPDESYPKGATEIALLPKEGKPATMLLVPGNPVRYGAFDIYMTKLVFTPEIVVKARDGQVLFDGLVQLDPLVKKRGEFSFYGLFNGAAVGGGVYYQPEKNLFMVVVTRNGQRVVADMTFQRDQQVTVGEYVLSCAKLGQWSEIHVVHHRHKGLLIAGGMIALLGLAARIAFRPQRVWLEEAGEGCLLYAVGDEWQKALRAE